MPKIVQFNLPPGGTNIELADNTDSALVITDTAGEQFMKITTTDNAEQLELGVGAGDAGAIENAGLIIREIDGSLPELQICDEMGFISDPDTMMRRKGANTIAFKTAGAEVLVLGPSYTDLKQPISGTALTTVGALSSQIRGTFTATNTSAEITSGSSTFFTLDLHVGSALELFEGSTSRGVFTVIAIDSGGAALTLDSAVSGLSSSPKTGMTGKTDSGELFAVKTGDSQTLFSVEPNRYMFAPSNLNVVLGSGTAGEDLTTGASNLIVGYNVGTNVTTGEWNVFVGNSTVDGNAITDPDRSVVVGAQAGRDCRDDNVYVGMSAGQNVGADQNVAIGSSAMTVTGPERSVAIGYHAHQLCTGTDNVVVGHNALDTAGDADNCVALGSGSLGAATGNSNIGIGKNAGNAVTTGSSNICIGSDSDATAGSSSQIAIGLDSTANGTNCIALGSAVTGAGSHTMTLGDTQMVAVVNEQSGFDRTACLGDPARPWGGLMTGAKQFFSTPQDCSAVNTTDTGVIKQFNAFGAVSQVKIPAYSIISNVSVTIYDPSGASTHNAAVYTSTTSGTAAGSAVAGTVVEILGAGAAGTRSTDTTGSASDIDLKATKGKTWYNETKFHVGSADVYVYVASAGTSNSGTAGATTAMLTVEFIGLD